MNGILNFIHSWENRNSILVYDLHYINKKTASELADILCMPSLGLEDFPEKIKILSKEAYERN